MNVIAFEKLPGEKLSDKVTRRYVSGEKATLVRLEVKEGAIVPFHHHINEQITYVLQGKIKIIMEGKAWLVASGEVLVIPPNVPHQFEFLEDSVVIDAFAPPRVDWLAGDSYYLIK